MNCEKQASLNPNLSNMVLLSMSLSICLAQVTTSRSWKLCLMSPTNLFFLLLSLLFGNQLWYFLCLNLNLLKFLLISGFLAFFRHCLCASKRLSIRNFQDILTETRTLTNLQYGSPSKNSTSTARLKIIEDIRMEKCMQLFLPSLIAQKPLTAFSPSYHSSILSHHPSQLFQNFIVVY